MNSDSNCYGYTSSDDNNRFNTPVDLNGFSILTGMSKGGESSKDKNFTLVGLETY